MDDLFKYEIPVRSTICITPENCYPVQTYLPAWMTAAFIAAAILIIRANLK